ncbi:MAG: NAD(P)-dependent oxidoreductase [Candidatus Bathyarchaeia archaeon]
MKVLIVTGRWAKDIEESPVFGDLAENAEVVITTEMDQEVLSGMVDDVDVIITGAPIKAEVINNAENLKLIQTTSVGFDHIDAKTAAENGVAICNAAEANANSVAELTFGLALDLARRISIHNKSMKEGGWGRIELERQVQIRHKTLGIIGLGAIGSRVAQIGVNAFDMEMIACDPYIVGDRADQFGGRLVDMDAVFREGDIVTVHVPLSDETRHMIGEREFRMMKPTAIFINTSRGPVIDEEALIRVLKDEGISGAGLDVFETEPLPEDSPLRELDNVVLTPHIGSTPGALKHMVDEALLNVLRIVKEKEPYHRRLKTPEVYYKSKRWKR